MKNKNFTIASGTLTGGTVQTIDTAIYVYKAFPETEGNTINQLFKEIPLLFIERLKEINIEIVDSQISSINNAINIIKKQKFVTNSYIYSSEMTVEKQIKYAKDWCKRYNIPYKY